jgi:hypothetical protein
MQSILHHILKIILASMFIFSLDTRLSNVKGNEAQQGIITQTTATLSQARHQFAATFSEELVFFGGGESGSNLAGSSQVDIYNVTNGIWTTATLSHPRGNLAATSLGNLVFFGGGDDDFTGAYYNTVDIYNVSNGSWSTTNLSQAREALAATSVGNFVLFGGGRMGSTYYNVVDIYNVVNNTWTTATLSVARGYFVATSVANQYALFAGGFDGSGVFNAVDIFDSLKEMWSTATLSQARQQLAAASLLNLAFFGGGSGSQVFNVVDIFNATMQTWSTATLSQARYLLAAAAIGDIVAFGGGNSGSTPLAVVDMYNVTSNIWFTAALNQSRYFLTAASSMNKIVFGGGQNVSSDTNFVDIFEVYVPPPPLSPVAPPSSNNTITTSLQSSQPLSNAFSSVPGSPSVSQYQTFSGWVTGRNVPVAGPNSVGLLAGLLSALVILIAAAVIVAILILRKKRKKNKKKIMTNQQVDNYPMTEQRRGTIIYPATEQKRETVVLSTISNTMTTTTTRQPGTETMKGGPGQIPFNELEIGKEVGEGNYGRVCVGKWKTYRVAMKFCQNRGKMDEFLREVNLMISLPPHPNVVRMYGVSIDATQPIIVMEFCPGGSLDKLLFDKDDPISLETKIRWLKEIAQGMLHLHKYNVVHRDLASRNILLSSPNSNFAHLKISDFGMSRVLQQGNEGRTLNKIGPIRWMAPESIGQQVYSKKSDAWMFGMVVYEIIAQCEPHSELNIDSKEMAALIRDKGLTPIIPSDCPQKLRQVMQMCWNRQPEQRPNMEIICTILEQQTMMTTSWQAATFRPYQ